jgi:NAD(P)H-hydrate epimerase
LKSSEKPEFFMKESDVLVCGCGWGSCAAAENLRCALSFPGKLILDADALNLVSGETELWRKRENLLITPHPGEAARLMSAFDIADQHDRRKNALALAENLGCTVLLKGRDTVVAAPRGRAVVIAAGTPLLATAGSGDVLAGIIGAVASNGLAVGDAAMLGAYIHGIAGESAQKIFAADELPDLAAQVVYKLQHNALV